MRKRKKETALDWETLRLGIERCDLDLLIDFYAEDARLSIVNAAAPHASLFELGGKGEIAKHLRVTFGPEVSHRVEREAFIGGDRMTFRESCDYPDGGRVVVESTLEVSDSTRSHPKHSGVGVSGPEEPFPELPEIAASG